MEYTLYAAKVGTCNVLFAEISVQLDVLNNVAVRLHIGIRTSLLRYDRIASF